MPGAIAEVSVASRRWSYRDLLTEAELATLSVEDTTADFAQGLAELPDGAAVFVAERAGRVVGYAYVLASPDADVPAGTSELGSLLVETYRIIRHEQRSLQRRRLAARG